MDLLHIVHLIIGVALLTLVVPLTFLLVVNWKLKNKGCLRIYISIQIPFNIVIGILNLYYAFTK